MLFRLTLKEAVWNQHLGIFFGFVLFGVFFGILEYFLKISDELRCSSNTCQLYSFYSADFQMMHSFSTKRWKLKLLKLSDSLINQAKCKFFVSSSPIDTRSVMWQGLHLWCNKTRLSIIASRGDLLLFLSLVKRWIKLVLLQHKRKILCGVCGLVVWVLEVEFSALLVFLMNVCFSFFFFLSSSLSPSSGSGPRTEHGHQHKDSCPSWLLGPPDIPDDVRPWLRQ